MEITRVMLDFLENSSEAVPIQRFLSKSFYFGKVDDIKVKQSFHDAHKSPFCTTLLPYYSSNYY